MLEHDFLDAAGLTPEKRTEAEDAYQSHVRSFKVACTWSYPVFVFLDCGGNNLTSNAANHRKALSIESIL